MLKLSGYTTAELLHLSERTTVIRAVRAKDGARVVLKAPSEPHPANTVTARLEHEHVVLQQVAGQGVVGTYGIERELGRPVLVLEDFGGISLAKLIGERGLALDQALELAVQLATALARVHEKDIVHKDVNPHNVLVEPQSRTLKLADFGLASVGASRRQVNASTLEGTLAYIAPEQTGRMNRSIDHRSDLYAFGATLYAMLTGHPPFVSADPLELVHAHVARRPPPLTAWLENVPGTIERLLARLLAKPAESRYQTARGLLFDLESCRAQLAEQGFIGELELGRRETCTLPIAPARLVGRAPELEALKRALDRAERGGRELVRVSGVAGIGKSALVQELVSDVARLGGIFATGKLEQYRRDVAYVPLARTCGDVVRQLLALPSERVAQWRSRLTEALGGAAGALAELVPDVHHLLDPSPSPELPPAESRSRIQHALATFFQTVLAAERVVVLVMDDTQWADPASIELVGSLLLDGRLKRLLVVLTHRRELPDELAEALEKVVAACPGATELRLEPLPSTATRELVAEMLSSQPEEVDELSRILHDRTLGSPFHVWQSVRGLYAEGSLWFDNEQGRWSWNLERLLSLPAADTVVSRLVGSFAHLPEDARRMLAAAACIGSHFSLGVLSQIMKPMTGVGRLVERAIRAEIVRPERSSSEILLSCSCLDGDAPEVIDAEFVFLHDRLQQAALESVSDTERQALHLAIARTLADQQRTARVCERVFDILEHLERAGALGVGQSALPDWLDRAKLARLYGMAGRRAKATGAFTSARGYFAHGRAVLENATAAESPLTTSTTARELVREQAECELVLGNASAGEALLDELLAATTDPVARAELLGIRMTSCASLGRYAEVIATGRQALEGMGYELPADDELDQALEPAYRQFREQLGGRSPEELERLPTLTEPREREIARVLQHMAASAYVMNSPLYEYVMLRIASQSLEHGHSPESVTAYAGLGPALLRAQEPDAYEQIHAFGSLGLRLSQRTRDPRAQARMLFNFGHRVDHWKNPFREQVGYEKQAFQKSLEVGDVAYAGFSLAVETRALLFACQPLETVTTRLEEALSFLKTVHAAPLECAQLLVFGFVRALRGKTTGLLDFAVPGHDEAQLRHRVQQLGFSHGYAVDSTNKLKAALLAADFGESERWFELASRSIAFVRDTPYLPEFELHRVLLGVERARHGTPTAELLPSLEAAVEALTIWSRSAPANYRPMERLARAELASLIGQGAPHFYEEAIDLASTEGNLYLEGLAASRAARFHLDRQSPRAARAYVEDAIGSYEQWGALAAADALRTEYALLIGPSRVEHQNSTSSSSSSSHGVDLYAAFEAAHAISSELELHALLERLMPILVRTAGARHGILAAGTPAGLVIQARASADPDHVEVLAEEPLERADPLIVAVVNYVARTTERVVLDDAALDIRFRSARPGSHVSVLCIPLFHRGRTSALLYLENDLVNGAFTEQRVRPIELLSTQAAAALENARLYEQLRSAKRQLEEHSESLEQAVRDRTRELVDKNVELQAALEKLSRAQDQLVLREKMASIGMLVAGVAHEINTPVGAMISITDTQQRVVTRLREHFEGLQSEDPNIVKLLAKLDETSGVIARAGTRVRDIVQRLKSFARLDEAELKLADINEGLEDTLVLLHHEMKQRIEVVRDYGDIPRIACFPGRLNQVFMNLLNNAQQAIPDSGRIVISTRVRDQELTVSISDSGVGIPKDRLSRIFDPGYTTKGVRVGTGLGLSICYEIVREHLGRIEVESREGDGSTFSVIIPTDLEETRVRAAHNSEHRQR